MSRCGHIAVLMLLLVPGAALAADPIAEFHLGPSAAVTTKVKFIGGTVYPMQISGYRIVKIPSPPPEGTATESQDAFSCFDNSKEGIHNRQCKNGQVSDVVSMTARTGESTTGHPLQEFIPDGEPMAFNSAWHHPPFRGDHDYTFNYKPALSGKLVLATSEQCSGFKCTGLGFDVKIFAPDGDVPDPCADPSQCATVVEASGEVSFRAAGRGPLLPLKVGAQLGKGDDFVTGVDSDVQLKFVDGTILKVSEMTELLIDDLLTAGNRQKVQVSLKLGEVSAQVNPKHAFQTDFKVKTPSGTAGVRGTVFSVFYDPSSKTMIETTREGSVEVDPAGAGLTTALVPAGKEVQVTPKAITALAPIGKAGARGGVNRRDALAKVLSIVGRAKGRCKISTPRANAFALKPARGGWAVAVRLTGRHKGTSKWTVRGRRVTAVNALAKRVRRGCG